MAESRFLIELHEASWNGAFFFPEGARKEAGHDDVFKKIASSDRAVIEQLGKKSPVFTIRGTIAARRSRDGSTYATYEEVRDAWEEACDTPGVGILIHPTRGKLENIKLRTYSIDETFSNLGEAPISMVFGRSDEGVVPIVEGASVPKTSELALDAGDAAQRSMEEAHEITSTNTGNLEAAIDKVTGAGGILDTFNDAVGQVRAAADTLQGYQQAVSEFAADVVGIVQDAQAFGDSIRNLYNALKSLPATFIGAFNSLKNMFDFGDGDTPSAITTSGRSERERNRITTNNMVQAVALAEAMEVATQIEFGTVEEIDEIAAIINEVFEKFVDRAAEDGPDSLGGFDRDTLNTLSILRNEVASFFAEKKLTTQRVIDVDVERATPAQLSYRYYGNTDNTDAIMELNGLRNGDPVEGVIRMVSE